METKLTTYGICDYLNELDRKIQAGIRKNQDQEMKALDIWRDVYRSEDTKDVDKLIECKNQFIETQNETIKFIKENMRFLYQISESITDLMGKVRDASVIEDKPCERDKHNR